MNKISNCMSPLHFAAEAGSKKITEWLISIGADVNAKDHTGKTPLDWAEEGCCVGAMKIEKKQTADLLRKHGGKTGEELEAEATKPTPSTS